MDIKKLINYKVLFFVLLVAVVVSATYILLSGETKVECGEGGKIDANTGECVYLEKADDGKDDGKPKVDESSQKGDLPAEGKTPLKGKPDSPVEVNDLAG
jgi:hypothetical protein